MNLLNTSGQTGHAGLVLGMVVIVVALFIGLYLYAEISDAIPRGGFDADQNTTFENIQDNAESGFDLAAILPIVIVAFAIIGILVGGFAFKR